MTHAFPTLRSYDLEVGAPLCGRAAIEKEAEALARIAKTQAAASLVQIFLNDQLLKKKFKAFAKQTTPITQAAVLGAGIMGGGIAYTSALRGTPVRMKDIQQGQLDLLRDRKSTRLNSSH